MAKRPLACVDPNENLACEILELHSLRGNGPCSLMEMRALAPPLTALPITREGAFAFREGFVAPAAETAL